MIINGKKIEGSPKQAKVVVAGKELDLTLVNISARMKTSEVLRRKVMARDFNPPSSQQGGTTGNNKVGLRT